MTGRQRPSFVETLGRLLGGVVTAARVHDPDGAMPWLEGRRPHCSRRRLLGDDPADRGDLVAGFWGLRPWRNVRLELVKRPEGTQGVLLLPQRWMVERTVAWVARYRRLTKDYEYVTQTREAMIRGAMIHLMIRRLARMPTS